MKKAQRRDFFREVWKSRNRFISILLITALGVAFYAGVRSAEPDMRLTADQLYDEMDFMDIRVVSTLGLTEDDLAAIREIPGVLAAEPAMETEAFCQAGEQAAIQVGNLGADNPVASVVAQENVLWIFSLGEEINRMQVNGGRLPEQSGECFMDELLMQSMGLNLGDTLKLRSGAKDEDGQPADILDTLEQDTYTIVGYGEYAWYLNWERGTAGIGDGKQDGYIGILLEDFYQDPEMVQAPIYHNIFVSVEGAEQENCYLDAYEDRVDEVIAQIEEIAGERCDIRYTAVVDDAQAQIADAKEEIADAEQEIADAEAELADAEQEIADGEKELADGRQEIEDAKVELADGRAELADGRAELADAKTELADARKQLDEGWIEYQDGLAELEENETKLTDGEKELADARTTLDEEKRKLEEGRKSYEEGLAQWEAGSQELAASRTQLEAGEEQFFAGFAAMGITDRQQVLAYLEMDPELKAQYQQIQEGLAQVAAGEEQLATSKAELDAAAAQIAEGETLLAEGEATWTESQAELAEARTKLEEGRTTLAEALAELEEGEVEYNDGVAEIQKAEKEIADGEKELADAEIEIADAEAELADGEKELADGKAEYEEKKAEADVELADAKKEIADAKVDIAEAEADLAELEEPEWIVLKRSDSVQTFIEYGMDAERIGAIGEVFPALFFLVATLVCLTTMTRMVEEERTQIGTMKALGYSKAAVASKYILYALAACLLGGVLGALAGSKIFPFVIIKAYQILYTNTPEPLTPIHMDLTIVSILIGVCCTVLATAMSSYRALSGVPAELMRPVAPKQGKRVLLERIGFLWKRLNFTWKSTLRNLFRYKKRLFMTIFGIGGSMALLMVGFGLRDSVNAISGNQYRTIWTYDAALGLEEDTDETEEEDFARSLVDGNQVTDSLRVRQITMDAEANDALKSVTLFVPERLEGLSEFLKLKDRITGETYELEEGGVVISEKLSLLLNLEVGSTFELKVSETERYPVTVTAITENYMYHYVYMTADTYRQIMGEDVQYNQLLLKLGDPTDEELSELSSVWMANDLVQSFQSVETLQEKVSNMLRSLDMVVIVLILAAGLLAFIVLYNLNNISIMERRRELATLKVLGFYDIEVASYVYRENILLTVFGILAGVGLGIAMHRMVIRTCEIDQIMFGRAIEPASYCWSILLTIVFAMIVNFAMFYRLRKIDMVESLKSVE